MRRHRDPDEPDLAMMGELKLIERIREKVRLLSGMPQDDFVVEGIGDDAAVLRWGQGDEFLLLTCDTVVENVHFASEAQPYCIGWKALGSNLSDIAAMGGIPQCAVVSLASPSHQPVPEIDDLYDGMVDLAMRYGVAIVGGDTVESREGLIVTVTVVGKVEADRYVSRSGARPGDAICVTGTLGGSLLGKHLAFLPRVEEGRFLATKCFPTAMIDISDGLASDLLKVLQASHVTAEIFVRDIPVSQEAARLAKQTQQSPVDQALHGGEDFELLFTLPEDNVKQCLDRFRDSFRIPATVIGRVKEGRGEPILVKEDGTRVALEPGGYEHFRERHRTSKGEGQE
jgi:thiamine-monophosphate kinase